LTLGFNWSLPSNLLLAVSGQTTRARPSELEGLASGETVPVLYLEDDPSANTASVA